MTWGALVAIGVCVANTRARAEESAVAGAPSNGVTRDAANAQIELGLSKYEAGEYRNAAELFLDAYKRVPDANLLYNAARCYERLGENRKAIVRYQQFIEAPDVDEGGKSRANAALQRLEQAEFLALRKGPSDRAQHLAEPESEHDRRSETAGSGVPWYLLGLGTVALGGGAWSLVSGIERRNTVTSDPAFDDVSKVHALTRSEAERRLESSQRRLVWGATGLATGGVLVASAVVWLLLESSEESGATPMSVDLRARRGETSVVLGGRF